MKLKGHCKIELTDKKTGKVESWQNAFGILQYCWGNEYPS